MIAPPLNAGPLGVSHLSHIHCWNTSMTITRIGFESFYGLGCMLLFLVIGTAANFMLAQAPFRRRDAENLGTILFIALVAAVLHALQLLVAQTDTFWLHLLALVL